MAYAPMRIGIRMPYDPQSVCHANLMFCMPCGPGTVCHEIRNPYAYELDVLYATRTGNCMPYDPHTLSNPYAMCALRTGMTF
eukprot:336286-Prymnesium_polylepis.1